MLKLTHGCTTFLVGKKATLDGSTIIARDEDNASDSANPQRFVVIDPQDQPREFTPIAGDYQIKLPDQPLRYTSTPDADSQYGVYGGAGINSDNVAIDRDRNYYYERANFRN